MSGDWRWRFALQFHLVKSRWNFTALPKRSQPATLAKFSALLHVKKCESLLEKKSLVGIFTSWKSNPKKQLIKKCPTGFNFQSPSQRCYPLELMVARAWKSLKHDLKWDQTFCWCLSTSALDLRVVPVHVWNWSLHWAVQICCSLMGSNVTATGRSRSEKCRMRNNSKGLEETRRLSKHVRCKDWNLHQQAVFSNTQRKVLHQFSLNFSCSKKKLVAFYPGKH